MVLVAAVQFDPHIGDTSRNVEAIERHLVQASEAGSRLVVFPECAVSGYVFGSREEAVDVAETIPGPASQRIAAAVSHAGLHAVVGMLERVGDEIYNSAILCGPAGIEAVYRKTHTLCLGVDRFTNPGNIPYRVHQLPFGRIGILICYDLRFPEPSRSLALQGAQIIALPTNWPSTSTIQPEVFTRSRAGENRVFVIAANRVGVERGTQFLGRSQVVAPDGAVLAEASRQDPDMILQEIEPKQSDVKNVVLRPGEHEMDLFADRRPDLYGALMSEERLAQVR